MANPSDGRGYDWKDRTNAAGCFPAENSEECRRASEKAAGG